MQPQEILPSPEIEKRPETQESVDGADEKSMSQAIEQGASSSSPQGGTALTGVAVNAAQGAVQGAQHQVTTPAQAPSAQSDYPDFADDIDLIEKMWVQKAKKIVDETVGDPFKQNLQINKMKADYIKKRYDKDVKFIEES